MATVPSGATAGGFGRDPVPPDLLLLCKSLRPLPRALADLDGTRTLEVSALSEELLLEAAVAGRADCIYAFCRLNAEAVRAVVVERVTQAALPISIDAAVAEVLAEIADAARFVLPARVADLYRS